MADARVFIRALELPYERIRTVYAGDSEVRLYRNELTQELQIGKRFDILGIEGSAAVQEGSLLRRIMHPNVTPVYDVARVKGYPAPMQVVEVIMPYYERGSLYDAFLRGERFTVGDAVRLSIEALHGLAELHEVHGILHRDVKTPNVLLRDDGRLVLGDLGVAAPLASDGTAEALPNARLYSPPESFVSRRVGRAADLYQLGIVLHELASGPLPYDDPAYDISAVAARLDQGRSVVLPRHLRPAPWVPRRLRAVIHKSTSRDPGTRYPNAKAMVDALAAVPLVDWLVRADQPDYKRWEGATPQRPGRRFAVEARYLSAKRGRTRTGWCLSGLQEVSRWQRVLPDALVAELEGRQAADFFDSMVVRLWFLLSLVFLWGEVSEGGVSSLAVVERLDVVEDGGG
jgi:serine/threonine protein kinase